MSQPQYFQSGPPQQQMMWFQQQQQSMQQLPSQNNMMQNVSPEEYVRSQLIKITTDTETIYRQLRSSPKEVFWTDSGVSSTYTVNLLTEMELSLDKVIASLNLGIYI